VVFHPEVEVVGGEAWVDVVFLKVDGQGCGAGKEGISGLEEMLEGREGDVIGVE